jgi:glycosyltransferase involved in cell wall biosynthesis
VLINSRLVVQKNIHLVIEAMDSIKNLDVNLKIIGEGGELARLEDLITNLKIQNRVKLIGKVENELILRIFKNIKSFCSSI